MPSTQAAMGTRYCLTMFGVGLLAVWLVLALVATIGTALWLRRLWKRRNELTPWGKAAAVLVAASATLGATGTLVGLTHVLLAIEGESVDPSQQARAIAEGLSEAINWTALAILVCVPSVILLLISTRKRVAEKA